MRFTLILFLLSLFVFTACGGQNNVRTQENTNRNKTVEQSNLTPVPIQTKMSENAETECRICDFDFEKYTGDLTRDEIEGLLLALNDEYMAWATYDQINKDFDNPRPFINIQKAEARHAERLKTLFKTYDLPIPENKWIGDVPKFQSLTEACKAGVGAEIANRNLYEKLFKSTIREDILIVYRALQRASEENHLPAFERCSQGGGGKGYGRRKGGNR